MKHSNETQTPANIQGPVILLLLATLFLLLTGLVMVYSVTSVEQLSAGGNAYSGVLKQGIYAVLGIAAAVVAWRFIPFRMWGDKFGLIAWIICAVLIAATAIMGNVGLGAKRWISIGSVNLQPSEFTKIAIILMAARIIHDFRAGEISVQELVVQGLIFVFMPVGIIFVAQSDLGTTVIIVLGVLAVLWLGEIPLRTIIVIIAVGLILGVVAISTSSYRSDRFAFLDPWEDAQGAGYQIIHSYYAFSQGGLLGVGIGNSREKFNYLPMADTDFIYAVIGEETGLIGALFVVFAFLVFLYAGLRIARIARDDFAAMVSGSLTIMIVSQAFINIGCVIGLLPTTGKPLPFISAGGSSLIASLCMVGLILAVAREAEGSSDYGRRRDDLRVIQAQRDGR